ncbi:DMT family transporter [Granulicella sp. dw_53]|uniref:DMT family transporter n=1 Tax=Granulicella sp. dw_53 TaxID=2719792 RepID=UPI001BD5EC80|nr:DMT family transporter [Granulicella sp. dw_53]
MHGYAVALVLLSAILHATWNAQLKGNDDRSQFMANMSLSMGALALICVFFVPLPVGSAWVCIALSAILHIAYNLLLLQNYRLSDFSSAYPIARGISPLLVTLGAFLLMHQRPNVFAVCGVAMISAGIVFLSTGRARSGRRATLSALATGATIAAYTVTDGMGVQRSQNTLSYTAWVFASYLLMPVVLLLLRAPVRLISVRGLPRATGAGLFSLTAYTLVLWATRYVDVGIVSALRETSVLWAIVLGRVFLGEAFTGRRVVSASIICLGIALLVLKAR